jgi:hypothetical protein
MAGLEPVSVHEAVAALQGDMADNIDQLGTISSLAAAKRRQHRRQYLRRTIVRPPIASALPSLPAPRPRVSFVLYDALYIYNCFNILTLLVSFLFYTSIT